MKMRNLSKLGLMGLMVIGLSACDDTTGPGGAGEMQISAVGDESSAPAGSSSSEGTASGGEQSSTDGSAEGTVDFRARVYVRTTAGEWIEVTKRGAESARVQASGTSQAALVTSARVAAGSYDRVRVRFEEVNANVTSLRIGVGTLLTGSFHVQAEGGHAGTVERDGSFEIRGGSSARLLIDLNSGAWLSRANTQTRAVSRADFESAVHLRVE
jgi:hypothetical protein